MLGDALSFPIEGDGGFKRIAIGGGALFLFFLIVPLFWILGYAVRSGLAGIRQEAEPPELTEDIGGQIVDGLKAFVVSFVYTLIPLIIVLIAFFVGAAGAVQGGNAGTGAGIIGVVIGLVGILLLLVSAYVFPAGVMRMMDEDSLGAAFSIGDVVGAAFDSDYFVAWLIAIGVNIIVGIINQVLVITLVGIILLPFTAFYQQVVIFYLYGRGYGKSVGAERMGGGSGGSSAGTDPLSGTGGNL
jgi:hypothetical protein